MGERMRHIAVVVVVAVLWVAAAMGAGAEHIGPFPKGASDCVQCQMDVRWLSKSSFFLENIRLSDTCCDDRPVYFYAQAWEQFDFPQHYSHLGCNSVATFDPLPGSYSPNLRYLHIYCCVKGGACYSAVAYNPFA